MNLTAAPGVPLVRSPVTHPLAWLLALALAHVAVRVAISPALKWDEAEQMLWSQQLALGYGAQPPLYTWLQWGVNALVGPSVLALSLLKHALLALTYALMWLAGRELLAPRGAWWAAASLMLLPTLGWYSVRDHTHTVLVTAMACGAWWLLLRIVRQPRPLEFAALGLVCGLGMLAKYSFALVAGAMLLAALSEPQARRALLSRGWWWAPLVGLLVVLPHLGWLLSHLSEATAGTLSKMEIDAARGPLKGARHLLQGVAGTLLLFALFALWAFGGAWWRSPRQPALPWAQRVFGRYLLLVLVALLGMVLAGVTEFKGRWLLPLLCVVPLAAFAARPELQQHPRGARYTGAIVAMALLILLAAGLRPWFSGLRGEVDELNNPAAELGAALSAAGYDGRSPIIAADHMMAGLLRTRFPRASVGSCTVKDDDPLSDCVAALVARARAAGQGWLLVSRTDRLEPDWWALATARLPARPVRSIELPLRMVRDGTPPAHYQYLWQPAAPAPDQPQ